MKSHSKESPQRSCLRARSCCRFSPTSVDPGLGESAHLLSRDVLGRGENLDPLPRHFANPFEVGGDPRCVEAVDEAGHVSSFPLPSSQTTPAWRPGPASRRWEKNSSSSQLVHKPADSISSTPASRKQATRNLGQVEHPPGGDAFAQPSESVEHLVPHLVAAGADSGADRRIGRAHRLDPPCDDPRGHPAPSAMQDGDTARSRDGNGQAIGDEDERRRAGLADDVAIGLRSVAARRRELEWRLERSRFSPARGPTRRLGVSGPP